jgi:ureidoglycolate dehydrogenase (NAD+)
MATAAIPWGKLAQARARGETLPEGVALDSQGRVTTDPQAVQVVLPIAGPKGSGLGFMIECLTSLLGGFPLAAPMLSGTRDTGNMMNAAAIAVDPEAFGSAEDYAAEVDALSEALAALPRAEGFDQILMPGERGDIETARRKAEGIPLPGDLWDRLCGIAGDLGVSAPSTA